MTAKSESQAPKPQLIPPEPQQSAISLIGDMVGSRSLGQSRANAQKQLENLLDEFNRSWDKSLLADFTITLGDEFQGLLKTAVLIPDIIWQLATGFEFTGMRIGIGCGLLSTPRKPTAIGMDGPAWYAARAALDRAKKEKLEGGVFEGFAATDVVVLNGIARLIHWQCANLTRKQREVLTCLRNGLSQNEAARILNLTPQTVNKQVKASGWVAYLEGERAWREVLGKYDFTMSWEEQ